MKGAFVLSKALVTGKEMYQWKFAVTVVPSCFGRPVSDVLFRTSCFGRPMACAVLQVDQLTRRVP